jgi:hypothetical protein
MPNYHLLDSYVKDQIKKIYMREEFRKELVLWYYEMIGCIM